MTIKDFLFSPQTGWVALGLFVAGLYGFAVRMTHRRAKPNGPPRKTGEFQRVGLENGAERRSTVETRPVADPMRRSTVETRPVADSMRRSTVEVRPVGDAGRRSTVETRPATPRGGGRA